MLQTTNIQYSFQPTQFPNIPLLNLFLPTMNPPQIQMCESQLLSNENVRYQQNSIQPSQQAERTATQTVERLRLNETETRNIYNLLIPPIPAYLQQQTSRIPLLPFTTERNQQHRQIKRSKSPTVKKTDESEESDFLDEIIHGIAIPYLSQHKSDIEIVQQTWQNREYDQIRALGVIKYKNSKLYCQFAIQKPFTLGDWSQSIRIKLRRNESVIVYERQKENAIENRIGVKLKRLDKAILDAEAKINKAVVVAAVAVPMITNKYKNIGQGKEILQPHELMDTRDPRGHEEKESERKLPKQQQYSRLMDVVEKFHEIMKPIIEEEKKKPKIMLPRQYYEYPNKDGPVFFYPLKTYRPTPNSRPKDLNRSEEKWKQFDGDIREDLGRISQKDHASQDYQTQVNEWLAEQIIESETESKNQEQLTNELERIVADGTDDNGDNDQSEHAIEPKHFTNGNDALSSNDNGTQLQAIIKGEANLEIQITKISANTPPHNPSFITIPPELGQVKKKVVEPKKKIQSTNDHHIRSKTGSPKSVPDKSLGSPVTGANSDSSNHIIQQQERRKQEDAAPVTEDKSVKRFKDNKTSAESKKQKQESNFENQIEIVTNFETDKSEQSDQLRKNGGRKRGQRS
ncbi:MAG: hypothetical protein EZS28_016048 [Streblomastix strix]|uniref:Uncharacterized protein n=1 Tax=Streblomastix strix TaxID=222440 RepID=A0A5J4W0Q1_9EUKA|nr:MAG: hypothetical protein EZS28_016048 [Streblomastix strix]